ncbi:MAG: CBS domain-containing protein, partial [Gammaproteobacteria bacterium]|nr:CBS domain-containing protein [Gammaproteobacteria bacterium]
MQSRYRSLPTVNLAQVTTLVNPPIPTLTLDSPACVFMTDFLSIHPVVVSCKTNVTEARSLMKQSYVRSLLVTDIDGAGFNGIVTATDINGGKVL